MSVPHLLPFLLAALSLAVLIWSLIPSTATENDSEDDPERLYQDELARRRAVLRAHEDAENESRKRKLIRSLGFGNIGDALAESEEDRRAEAEAEARRQRMIREAREAPPPPKFDVPLKAVLERIAFESEWAATRNWDSPSEQWQKTMWWKPLAKELLRPLASDDIPSRGIKSTKEGDENGHSDIPADYWRSAKIEIDADRLLCEPGFDYVFNFAEGVMYHDIRLRRVDVDREWPPRTEAEQTANPSPFIEWAKEWRDEFDERLTNSQMEYERLRRRAVAETREIDKQIRRALIAKGRDVVHRFRTSGEAGFEKFASQDRGYLDIQPHLGDEYQAERTRAADKIIYGPEHDELRAAALLRELVRLEKEWKL